MYTYIYISVCLCLSLSLAFFLLSRRATTWLIHARGTRPCLESEISKFRHGNLIGDFYAAVTAPSLLRRERARILLCHSKNSACARELIRLGEKMIDIHRRLKECTDTFCAHAHFRCGLAPRVSIFSLLSVILENRAARVNKHIDVIRIRKSSKPEICLAREFHSPPPVILRGRGGLNARACALLGLIISASGKAKDAHASSWILHVRRASKFERKINR